MAGTDMQMNADMAALAMAAQTELEKGLTVEILVAGDSKDG